MAGSGVNEIIAPSFFFCLEKQKSNKKATTNKTYLVTILKTICPLFLDVLFPQEVASMAYKQQKKMLPSFQKSSIECLKVIEFLHLYLNSTTRSFTFTIMGLTRLVIVSRQKIMYYLYYMWPRIHKEGLTDLLCKLNKSLLESSISVGIHRQKSLYSLKNLCI